jgi:hypothetical protein
MGRRSGTHAVYRVRVSAPKLEQIVDLKNFHQTSGLAGGWMGLAPDDSPLVMRDAGTQDIHALTLELP